MELFGLGKVDHIIVALQKRMVRVGNWIICRRKRVIGGRKRVVNGNKRVVRIANRGQRHFLKNILVAIIVIVIIIAIVVIVVNVIVIVVIFVIVEEGISEEMEVKWFG